MKATRQAKTQVARKSRKRSSHDLRLLYVIDSLAPFGAEQSLAALAPEYLARGIALDVAYLKDGPGLRGALEASGADLYWVGKSRSGRIG